MKKTKILIIILTLLLVILLYYQTTPRLDKKKVNVQIINITQNDNTEDIILKYRNINSVGLNEVKTAIPINNSTYNIIIDESILYDKFILQLVKKTILNGKRVVLKGDGINKHEMYGILGFNNQDSNYKKRVEIEDENIKQMAKEGKLYRIGIMFYTNSSGNIATTGINVENRNENFIYDTFVSCIIREYK